MSSSLLERNTLVLEQFTGKKLIPQENFEEYEVPRPALVRWDPQNSSTKINYSTTYWSCVPVNLTNLVNVSFALEQFKFEYLTAKWQAERAGMSAPEDIFNCDSYKNILLMGSIIKEFIRERLEDETLKSDFWFDALERLHSGFSPVDEEDAGDLKAINKAWLNFLKR